MEGHDTVQLETQCRPLPRIARLPFSIVLILPAQLIMLLVVVVPTLIVVWLSLTDWQPTDNIPWFKAEFSWFWNFYDLLSDERFVGAVLRTLFVVALCVSTELVLAVALALLFLDEWPWRKVAVSVIILPMMVVPVDAANAFFMLFNDHGPINQLLSLVLDRPFEYSWLADPHWALLPIIFAEVWQWTPLMFLLVLTGFLNVPHNQWRAALGLGAYSGPSLLPRRAAPAKPAGDVSRRADPCDRDLQNFRRNLHPDSRRPGSNDRVNFNVYVQRSVRVFPHGLRRGCGAARALRGGLSLPGTVQAAAKTL